MRPRSLLIVAGAAALLPAPSLAQSLARRIASSPDGRVAFTFAARPGVCGDGRNFMRDGFGGSRIVDADRDDYWNSRGDDRPCRRGPVRVVATMSGGEVVRLRTFAGTPVPDDGARDLGDVPVREAVQYLAGLAERGTGRVAADALFPTVIADSTDPWPRLLRLARDEDRSRATRREAAMWLGRGAAWKLGLRDDDEASAEAEVRQTAVFGLSQLPRERAVPELIAVARTGKHDDARAAALFWLGQTGDPRAFDLFEEILR
jgi:hypothetical protein